MNLEKRQIMNRRNRWLFVFFTILVMIMGLLSRKYTYLLPDCLNIYLGDILWAMMIFLGVATLLSKLSTQKITILSLLFCYSIEFSQAYHAEWIDSIRETTLGHLVLGNSFVWSDLVAYTLGVFLGVLLDKLIKSKTKT